MSPMELIIEERVRRVKKAKRSVEEERRETVKRWQRLWSQSNKEKWTRKLIPGVPPWYYKAHEEINHFLILLLNRSWGFQSVSLQNREDSQRNVSVWKRNRDGKASISRM